MWTQPQVVKYAIGDVSPTRRTWQRLLACRRHCALLALTLLLLVPIAVLANSSAGSADSTTEVTSISSRLGPRTSFQRPASMCSEMVYSALTFCAVSETVRAVPMATTER